MNQTIKKKLNYEALGAKLTVMSTLNCIENALVTTTGETVSELTKLKESYLKILSDVSALADSMRESTK